MRKVLKTKRWAIEASWSLVWRFAFLGVQVEDYRRIVDDLPFEVDGARVVVWVCLVPCLPIRVAVWRRPPEKSKAMRDMERDVRTSESRRREQVERGEVRADPYDFDSFDPFGPSGW